MNFSKSKVLLKKINAIHDSAESFDNKFSALERDLMLQYLRQLYECVSGDEPSMSHSQVKAEVRSNRPAPVVESAPPAPQKMAQVAHNAPGSNGQDHVAHTSTVVAPTAPPQPKHIQPVEDPELVELFDELGAPDKSQRFGNTPITDISKAMGINDRILTINELFKGDQQVFQDVIHHLNGLSSFESARQYLIQGIAKSNGWVSDKKRNKAAVFIKLLRRRY